MGQPGRGAATYDDVLKAPLHQVAELINGTLYTHPRPRARHARAASVLGGELHQPFGKGAGGPGGWLLLDEPELHLGRQVLVPGIAGWRRDRMPELPDAAFIEIAPNWVLEVLSPSTEAVDRSEKMPVYAAHGVTHVWLVDPTQTTLEVYRLDGTTYRLLATHAGAAKVRVEPFDAIELALAALLRLPRPLRPTTSPATASPSRTPRPPVVPCGYHFRATRVASGTPRAAEIRSRVSTLGWWVLDSTRA